MYQCLLLTVLLALCMRKGGEGRAGERERREGKRERDMKEGGLPEIAPKVVLNLSNGIVTCEHKRLQVPV